MDLPKEIIEEELLMRLPVKSLMKFKCILKDWYNFISHDSFRKRYHSTQQSKGNVPTGFIFKTWRQFLYTSNSYSKKEELESLVYLLKGFNILAALKGGLLLLNKNDGSLYIYDLVSKQHVSLPGIHNVRLTSSESFGFKCEEESSEQETSHRHKFHYKVVCIEDKNYKESSTQSNWIFSSATGTWIESIMKAKSRFFINSYTIAKVIGGVFHWHDKYLDHIIAYDCDDPNGHTVLLEIPSKNEDFAYKACLTELEGTKDGTLQYITINEMKVDVWIMSIPGQNYMHKHIIGVAKWRLASSITLWDIGCFRDLKESPNSEIIGVDPADTNIVYLTIAYKHYGYHHLEKRIVFTSTQNLCPGTDYLHIEWPTWPCL